MRHPVEYETPVFPILNLEKLTADYVLFRINGLHDADEDYDTNIQYLIKKLSFDLKHPISIIHKEGKPYLVVRNETTLLEDLPLECAVKKADYVYFEREGEPLHLDFKDYTPETKSIILRFLQFDLQTELNKNQKLWQPQAGSPMFNKDTWDGNDEVAIYNGFIPRIVELPTGGFGICVDITKKYVAKAPLPVYLTQSDFKRLKLDKCHLVYHYGKQWYEINPDEFSQLTISQFKYKRASDNKRVSLLEDIRDQFKNGMPPEVAQLPDDASALIYRTSTMEERRVPAALCYQVMDTEDPRVRKLHRKSIVNPFFRRKYIRVVYHNYLSKLSYGAVRLEIGADPILVPKRVFQAPDITFRNDVILSTRSTQKAIQVTMEQLGAKRKELLSTRNVGFYTNAPFEKQYVILPETIYHMYGNETFFLRELALQVNSMHPTEEGWKPEIILYDDRNKKTSTNIGFEILKKIGQHLTKHTSGYAVVMLPSEVEKNKRKHDELAALVVKECYDLGINASIMHTGFLNASYEHKLVGGETTYIVKPMEKNKYAGYLKGVAINQVLLNNERWPFILHTPLHADLTIGIDVKKHMAGFTFVDKHSKNISTKFHHSPNAERLTTGLVVQMLVKNITLQAQYAEYTIRQIVVHRDGRLFKSEREGILQAIKILKEQGILTEASVNIVEIPKHSIIPFRLFEVQEEYNFVTTKEDRGQVLNPQIGSWVKFGNQEAFLCTTGREFAREGSSNPLYVKYNSGTMSLEEILEDIYYLSCLAFTKPDDCSRFPITIKITDRRINNLGDSYNLEELSIMRVTLNQT